MNGSFFFLTVYVHLHSSVATIGYTHSVLCLSYTLYPYFSRIVNTCFIIFELLGDSLISWLPLYWELKIGLIIYLTLFNGSSVIYNQIVKLWLEKYEGIIDQHVSHLQNRASERVNDVAAQGLQQVRNRSTQIATVGLQWLGNIQNANPQQLLSGNSNNNNTANNNSRNE